MWPCSSRCGFGGGSGSLWKGFRVSRAKPDPMSLCSCCLQIQMWNSQLLFLSEWWYTSLHDDNGLKLQNCKQAQNKCFLFIKVAIVMVSLHSKRISTRTNTIVKDQGHRLLWSYLFFLPLLSNESTFTQFQQHRKLYWCKYISYSTWLTAFS